jgi:polysaccharide chain length determinant protein (PEP-CTERM system associated)
MWRFRWQMLAVSWLVALVGWVMVLRMPDIYESIAMVSVDTNSLLPDLTKGLTANENVMSEVDLVSKALLTRPNLETVARETDLDLRADTPQEMELLITGLQERVTVQGGRDNIFRISFQDRNRGKATAVVAALLDTFMESSLGAQGEDAKMSERAIAVEIENHEQRLLSAEAALAEFKARNLGYMPEDGSDYYSRLQAALASVGETQKQIRQLRLRRDEIARQLEGEEPVFGLMPSTPAQAQAGCTKARDIAVLRGQLSALQVDFTDKHPRIVMLRETIDALEEECANELAEMGGIVPIINPTTQSLDANPVYQNLRLQLSTAEVELASLEEQLREDQRLVAQLRSDVDKIGEVETQLKQLNRDYSVVEIRHQELLRRWETLQSKKRMDPYSDTVQFNVMEPPFASAIPVAPNRPMLLTAVLVFALGTGGAVAFALNQLNPVFFTRISITETCGLPVLGSVSLIMSSVEKARRRRRLVVWVGANLFLVATVGAVIVFESTILKIVAKTVGGTSL